jgi:hypothetical protein
MNAIIDRLRREPVLIVTALIVGLTAAQDALSGGADLSTILFAVIQAVLGWAARSFVTPTSAPVLAADTVGAVKGSADTVVIQPSPPGPTGVEGSH